MAVKEKTHAPAPTRAETHKAPAPITPAPSQARTDIRDHKKTVEAVDAATTVQRARASVTLQQRVGNARAAQMIDVAHPATEKKAPAAEPVTPKVPVLSTKIALPSPASKPPTAPEIKPPFKKDTKPASEKEAKASPEKALQPTREKETKLAPEKSSKPTAEKEPAAASAKVTVGTAVPIAAPGAPPPAPEEVAAAETPTSDTEAKGGKESKDATAAAEKGETRPAAGGEKKAAKPAEGKGPEEGGAGGAAPVSVKLHMPEPPAEMSPATKKRIGGVKKRASTKAAAHGDLPEGAEQVGDARKSVDEPDVEALAKAQQELITQVQAKPSQEIVELCQRIRTVIEEKRPPDEDALAKAEPESEAMQAGDQLNSTVADETKKVQDNYGPVNTPPTATPEKGEDLKPQPETAETAPINAKAATPDAVPAENVSLDADVADSQKKIEAAGMEKPTAKLAQSGPVAEAREAQGDFEQTAKEDPAKVLAKQQEELGKAETDMASLQAQALAALTVSRKGTVKKATSQQEGMVGSEESMRANASKEAKDIFDTTQTQVNGLLKDLASKAMNDWEAAKKILVSNFKAELLPIQQRVEKRHSGVGGGFVGKWDAVTGLPSWAKEGYTKAEKNFGDGVIAKLTEISTRVNSIILTCDELIKSARERIKKIFDDLPVSLQSWAAEEQGKFDKQLDHLQNTVTSTRDNFNKDLTARAAETVDAVRAEIADLRKKAGGILGRIVDAIKRFVDDPVKFIIEALLDILGIPPSTFWAVVRKIKKAISDIADDPENFANNLFAGLGQGFTQFFDNFGKHMINGFIDWLTGGLASAGVQLPKDFSLRSIITFFLQLMGITWPRIRKILAKHLGDKTVAVAEKVYSLLSLLIEKGPEGIFEMIAEKLNPQAILDKIIEMAVDYMISAIIKAATARIIMLFNPVGAILQAIEAIYRVLKWEFKNAARIFSLIETIVNGIADIIAGSIGGFANAVEKALAKLIAPVIAFIADYLGFGDLPSKIAETIKSFQEMILGLIEQALVWLIEKGTSLLAAVGIGKKEEKKGKAKGEEDIGEKREFTAGSKTHHLWIEGTGGAVTVVVATYKQSVKEMLDRLEPTAPPLGKEKITTARALLGITTNAAGQEGMKIEEAKAKPEDDKPTGEIPALEDKTVGAENELVEALKAAFEACKVGGAIVAMIGKQVVIRNVPNGDDKLTGDFEKPGVPAGYSAYQVTLKGEAVKPKKYYVKRLEKAAKEEERPQVHIDEDGILQLGPSREEADDSEKIQVYIRWLEVAGIKEQAAQLANVKDADDYRHKSRTMIVNKLNSQGPEAITQFMRNSIAVTPGVDNRGRSEIYEEAVSQHPGTTYQRTSQTFFASRYPLLGHDRFADGEKGDRKSTR